MKRALTIAVSLALLSGVVFLALQDRDNSMIYDQSESKLQDSYDVSERDRDNLRDYDPTKSDTAYHLFCADGSEVFTDWGAERGVLITLPDGEVKHILLHADTDTGAQYIADNGDFVMWFQDEATMIEIDGQLRYEDCLPAED